MQYSPDDSDQAYYPHAASEVAAIDGTATTTTELAVRSRMQELTEPDDAAERTPVRSRPWLGEVAGGVSAAVLGVMVAVWTFRLWDMHPRVPIYRDGDANWSFMVTKNLLRGRWYYDTSRLGWPFGQNMRDFPAAGDTAHLVGLKLLGIFSQDPILVTNVFFLGSYPLIAISGYVATRLIGLPIAAAVSVGVAYTAMPYHLLRGESHLFLANYAAVPLAVALIVRQAGPRPLLRRRPGARLCGYLHRDMMVGTLIVVLASSSGLYYAWFTAFLMIVAVALAASRRRVAAAWHGVAAVVAIVGFLFLQLLPSLWYQHTAGPNQVAARPLAALESYPLRLTSMLLPIHPHRLEFLNAWRLRVDPKLLTSEGSETLGLFASLGVVISLGVIVTKLGGRAHARWRARVEDIPVLVLASIMYGTYAGLNYLIGVAGITQFRGSNRISIFIAFMGLVVLAAVIRRAGRRLGVAAVVAASALTIASVYDTTPAKKTPDYESAAADWAREGAFFGGIEATLGQNAAVFQLPIADYPEVGPIGAMPDYAQLSGYLHNDTLNWSYGGVKGREADWRYRLDVATPQFLDDLLITGFSGLLVNTEAYSPDALAALDTMLNANALTPVGQSGTMRFYDLRVLEGSLESRTTEAERARRRHELLGLPDVDVVYSDGFYDWENSNGAMARWAEPHGTMIVTPHGVTGDWEVEFTVSTFAAGSWPLEVRVDDQPPQQFTVTEQPTAISVDAPAGADRATIRLSFDAPDDGALDARLLVARFHGYVVATERSTG